MKKKISCPSCGGSVKITDEEAVFIACPYCDTQINIWGEDLVSFDDVGTIEADGSPLQLGTRGIFEDAPFEVIGRIQHRIEEAFLNEWFILYQDGRLAWLREDRKEQPFLTLTRRIRKKGGISGSNLSLMSWHRGEDIRLFGKRMEVRDSRTFSIQSWEGKIPHYLLDYLGDDPEDFFWKGHENHLAYLTDLRRYRFTGIAEEYSMNEPACFEGVLCSAEELSLSNLGRGLYEGEFILPEVPEDIFPPSKYREQIEVERREKIYERKRESKSGLGYLINCVLLAVLGSAFLYTQHGIIRMIGGGLVLTGIVWAVVVIVRYINSRRL
jgi:hypothetical protein